MKKIILASLIAMSAQFAFAESKPATVDPAFAEVEAMVKANNMTGAYQTLEKLGKAGNPQALYNLGYLTQVGQGTTKDEKKAIQLYEQSASKGYPVADYVLGKNYLAGSLGLKQDTSKAKQYFEKASAKGFSDATVDLAVLLFSENNPASDKLALQKLDPLVKKGNFQAIHAKALYDISTGFKNKDEAPIKQGLASIQTLAQKGYIPALMAVGNMLTNGNIVPQNLPEAKKIFTALAKENVPQAQESLAVVERMMAEQAKVSTASPTKAAKKS
jgi:TPR repeat protein